MLDSLSIPIHVHPVEIVDLVRAHRPVLGGLLELDLFPAYFFLDSFCKDCFMLGKDLLVFHDVLGASFVGLHEDIS